MMRFQRYVALLFLFAAIAMTSIAVKHACAGEWRQFRGPGASGVADGEDPPVKWDAESNTNIAWKTAIPGLGHACPIVSQGCVFIVTAVSGDPNAGLRVGLYGDIAPVEDETVHSWQLYCLSEQTGEILWKRIVHEAVPKIERHTKATHANSTPATDGEHLVVFLGSEGLFCYDLCGNLLWKREMGILDSGYYRVPAAQWGFASSPIIYGNMVILQCDVQKDSYIAAFDVRNGCELWRTLRDDVPTWSTPTIAQIGSQTQLIVNGYKHAGGYDPCTGKELWKMGGGGDIPVPTPIVAHDLIFLSSAHGPQRPLCAIRACATGDITPVDKTSSIDQLAWYKPREGIYLQTPLVYGDYLYACRGNGILSCYEARTGKRLYRERLGRGDGGFTASPVAADGKLYFTSELGEVTVIKAGPKFEVLASNRMKEICLATPAISNGLLIIRAKSHVYGVGEPRSRDIQLTSGSMQPLRRTRLRRPDSRSALRNPFRAGAGLLRECLTGNLFR